MHYLCTAFQEEKLTGCSSVRLECLVWDQVVEGSNPFIPTKGEAKFASPLSCERIQGLLLFCYAKALHFITLGGPPGPLSLLMSLASILLGLSPFLSRIPGMKGFEPGAR